MLPSVLGFAATRRGDGDQHQRSKREDHGRDAEARPRVANMTEQPKNVHDQACQGTVTVASPAACKSLMGMAAMCLLDAVIP